MYHAYIVVILQTVAVVQSDNDSLTWQSQLLLSNDGYTLYLQCVLKLTPLVFLHNS